MAKIDSAYGDGSSAISVDTVTRGQAKYGVVCTPDVQPAYGVVSPPDVQPAYGVVSPPDVQPAYGVVYPPDQQAKYGVVCPPDVQPAYGVPYIDGPDLSITYEQLERNIDTLEKAIYVMKNSWNDGTKNNVNRLNNSWVGPDCEAYTKQLMGMDDKVQKTISSLELLCTTYKNARDMVKENQSKVISNINNS